MSYDTALLHDLYSSKNVTKFVKLVAYDIQGLPQETLEGVCTGGTINIDGKSSIRRSCSLTFVASENETIHSAYWGASTRFSLSIGLEHIKDTKDTEIIWFPMGWYIIATFSCV